MKMQLTDQHKQIIPKFTDVATKLLCKRLKSKQWLQHQTVRGRTSKMLFISGGAQNLQNGP